MYTCIYIYKFRYIKKDSHYGPFGTWYRRDIEYISRFLANIAYLKFDQTREKYA